MKKTIMAWILAAAVSVTFTACASQVAETPGKQEGSNQQQEATGKETAKPSEDKQPRQEEKLSQELLQMFPQNVGTQWIYNGFAEYGHQMKLDEITSLEGGALQYSLSGEVADMSDGEGKGDFSLALQYRISSQAVREVFVKGDKVPHKIKEFDMLRLPLKKGNAWTQKVSINGKDTELKAEIMEAGTDAESGLLTVKVKYTAPAEGFPNGQYFEERTFREKQGLIHFVNTYDDMIEFNYSLHSVSSS